MRQIKQTVVMGTLSAIFLFIGCLGPETKNVVDGLKCQEHLENLFAVLESCATKNETFPVTENGQLKLDEIVSENKTDCQCSTNSNIDCYIFRKDLNSSDLDASRQGNPTIIAMDKSGNHPVIEGKERVQVLMNQGFALSLLLSTEEADAWRKRLKNGDVFSTTAD